MKSMIIMLLLLAASLSIAQPKSASAQAKADSMCAERGHIISLKSTTLLSCPARVIDLDDRTIRISWDQNLGEGICERCARLIKRMVQEKPDTVIVWQRKGK